MKGEQFTSSLMLRGLQIWRAAEHCGICSLERAKDSRLASEGVCLVPIACWSQSTADRIKDCSSKQLALHHLPYWCPRTSQVCKWDQYSILGLPLYVFDEFWSTAESFVYWGCVWISSSENATFQTCNCKFFGGVALLPHSWMNFTLSIKKMSQHLVRVTADHSVN